MLIKVTQDHIDKGEQEDCRACPIALAINALLTPGYVSDVARTILIGTVNGTMMHKIRTPQIGVKFINLFDGGKYVVPIEFELDIPERFLK